MYARTLPFLIIEDAVTTTTASALLTSTVGFEVVRSEFSSDQKAPKDSGRDFRDSLFYFRFASVWALGLGYMGVQGSAPVCVSGDLGWEAVVGCGLAD